MIKPITTFHFYRGEKVAEKELVGITFLCRSESDEVKMSWEHTECKWLSVDEALKLTDHPGISKDLETFKKEFKKE